MESAAPAGTIVFLTIRVGPANTGIDTIWTTNLIFTLEAACYQVLNVLESQQLHSVRYSLC
jgi:hypothetical protein